MEYVGKHPTSKCAIDFGIATEIPYESTYDFVNTMRQSSNNGNSAYLWPSERIGFMRAVSTASQHLPVGHMISINNAQKVPNKFYDKSGNMRWSVLDLYHGTSPFNIPNIMGRDCCQPLELDVMHSRTILDN